MGLAIARTLASEGCSVVLFARREQQLAEEAQLIEADFPGSRTHFVVGDSADPGALRRVVDETLEKFGKLDILVNNTGGPPAGDFRDFDDGAWYAAFDLAV